jgi:hypothetical protein
MFGERDERVGNTATMNQTRVHAFTDDDPLSDHDAVKLAQLIREGELSSSE